MSRNKKILDTCTLFIHQHPRPQQSHPHRPEKEKVASSLALGIRRDRYYEELKDKYITYDKYCTVYTTILVDQYSLVRRRNIIFNLLP